MGIVRVRRGRAKPLWAGHPWVYAASIESVEGDPADGDEVAVHDAEGRFLARGLWNSRSLLRVRVLTLREDAPPLAALVEERVREAVALREAAGVPRASELHRVVHGEGDGLPGVVVDRCGEFLVVQISVLGMERALDALAAALDGALAPRGILLRGGARHAADEGVALETRVLRGEEPPDTVWAREGGVTFGVDLRGGAKTGHFSDQRGNREAFAALCGGRRVLDAFAGTGGFGLHALISGGAASVVALEGSGSATERLRANAARNGVADRVVAERGDVFRELRRLHEAGERFGAVSVDPPRMAEKRGALEGALKGYGEIHFRALSMLEDGGVLCASSCTGVMEEEAWEGTIREAARRARRRVQVLRRGGQGPDHPWSVVAPEGRYLKCLLARVTAFR